MGTLQKTAGTGTTNFIDLSVENSGTFRIGSGTIFLSGASASFTQTAGTTELSGGNLSATRRDDTRCLPAAF